MKRAPLAFFLIALATVPAQEVSDHYLSGEVGEFIDFVDTELSFPAEKSADVLPAYQRSVARIRKSFAAMIFGLRYTYIPGDRARSVEDRFTTSPLVDAALLAGMLKVAEQKKSMQILYTQFHYWMTWDEWQRHEDWQQSPLPRSQGRAAATDVSESLQGALRMAVRDHLRRLTANKPAESKGIIVLAETPRSFFRSGQFYTAVKLLIQVDEILPYDFF